MIYKKIVGDRLNMNDSVVRRWGVEVRDRESESELETA